MGGPPSPAQRSAAEAASGLTLIASDHRLEWMEDPWDDVARAGDWLLSLARETRPDVVHLGGYAHAGLPFDAPVVVGAHSSVCTWWQAVHGCEAPPSWDRYRAAVARGLSRASAVVAPTRAMLDALRAQYGPLGRSVVIPNGADREGAPRRDREPFILAAGRAWDPAKGFDVLARVAPSLTWPVVVAGSDLHPSGSRRPLAGVRSVGPLGASALAGFMDRAAIYALPARYEPFGLSALEAGLAGAALVLGDVPSLREVWGDAATYVAPGDEPALHEALTKLIASPAARADLAIKARARALRFSTARMVQSTLTLYVSLIAARKEPSCE